MKVVKFLSRILALSMFLLCLDACKSDKKQTIAEEQKPLNGFVDGLVREDTLAVEKLVDEFMKKAQDKQFGQAAAMLYKTDPDDAWNEPVLLDNEEIENVMFILKRFPVLSYRIVHMKFESALENEVKCTIVMSKKEDNIPEITNSWFFKPLNYLGGWRLCLMNSYSGDCSVDERDPIN